MTVISLKQISHRYPDQSSSIQALKHIDYTFKSGGAYALLGPSGCGKTTLLNILSGLITPTQGSVFFDENEVTKQPTTQRHIAQVFQFPVVYDTMSVFDNLAFPLKNQRVPATKIKARVLMIAEMLELEEHLKKTASALTPDLKQKISLGRGLVREDINLIMFDEPLTVIDPHLKWKLRTKLKKLHQQIGATLIYVTHDQTEALTFADQIVMIYEGEIIQSGTPRELFERSAHAFVGHFIGSPGMNFIPCERVGRQLKLAQHQIVVNHPIDNDKKYQLGIRPEFISLSPRGQPAKTIKIQHLGHYQIATVQFLTWQLKMIVPSQVAIPTRVKISFNQAQIHLYENGWRIDQSIKLLWQ